jgi:hypothetical protein
LSNKYFIPADIARSKVEHVPKGGSAFPVKREREEHFEDGIRSVVIKASRFYSMRYDPKRAHRGGVGFSRVRLGACCAAHSAMVMRSGDFCRISTTTIFRNTSFEEIDS